MDHGIPLWLQNRRALKQYPWQDGNVRTQVCVIGGGITGTLCALRLTMDGYSVVLLSQRPVGRGTTAHMLPASLCDCGSSLRATARKAGYETAIQLLRLTLRASDELEELCRCLPGGAGFSRRDSVIYAGSETDADQLRRDCSVYAKEGFDCVEMNRSAFGSTFAFPAYGAMVLHDGAVEVDPCILAQQAAAYASDNGAIIFENTRAEQISTGSDERVTIITSTHRTVTADCVVIAAGSACAEILTGISAGHTRYVSASRPVRSFNGWPGRCVVRGCADPGIICASSPDGRLVISSCATPGAKNRERLRGMLHIPEENERLWSELESAAQYLFPEVGASRFDFRWTLKGIRTSDGLPVVGRTRSHPGCIFAVSGGEGGVLTSVMLARIAAQEVAGLEPEEIRLFSPGRRKMAG